MYKGAQSFCVRGLEAINTARTETESKAEDPEVNPCRQLDVSIFASHYFNTNKLQQPAKLKELRTTIIGILSNSCVTDKLPTKTNLTRKKTSLNSLAIPEMEPVLTKPTETEKQTTESEFIGLFATSMNLFVVVTETGELSIVDSMLNVKPISQSAVEPKKTEPASDTIDRSTLMRLNIASFDKNVNGIVRLLNLCRDLVSMDASLITESDMKFMVDVVEFLGARGFSNYSPSEKSRQEHSAAAVAFTIALCEAHPKVSSLVNNVVS